MTRAGSIWLSAFLSYSRIKGDNGTLDSQLTPLAAEHCISTGWWLLWAVVFCGVLSPWVMMPWAVILHSFIVVSMVYGPYSYAVARLLPGLSPTVLLALSSLMSQPWPWLSLPTRRLQMAMTGTF